MANILKNSFFVYAIVDENNKYFYIGKGKKNRLTTTLCAKNNNWLKKNEIKRIKLTGKIPKVKILMISDENYCFEVEKKLITYYGRRDQHTGFLCNLTMGGEGASGTVCSEESRQIHRTFMLNNNPMKIPELRKKVSESKLGSKNPMYGKIQSDEAKRKRSIATSGVKHWNFGKHRSEKTKKILSEKHKLLCSKKPMPWTGKIRSREHTEKLRNSRCKTMYTLINSEGTIFQTKSITLFSKNFSLNAGHMYQVVKGNEKSHKGWKLISIESTI